MIFNERYYCSKQLAYPEHDNRDYIASYISGRYFTKRHNNKDVPGRNQQVGFKKDGRSLFMAGCALFLFQGRLVYDVRCYRLMDSDLPGFVLIWFGDPQLQDTVFVIGGNFFGIHIVGKVEAPFKTAERAFASIIALFLDFIVR